MTAPAVFGGAAHRFRVMLLYRRALELASSWRNVEDSIRPFSIHIRERFEVNRHLQNPKLIAIVLQRAEDELYHYRNPEPIVRRPFERYASESISVEIVTVRCRSQGDTRFYIKDAEEGEQMRNKM